MITIPFKEFNLSPIKEDDILEIDLKKNIIGQVVPRRIIYKKNADYFFFCCVNKSDLSDVLEIHKRYGIPLDKFIGDFYIWDSSLSKFDKNIVFSKWLLELKKHGINKLVQIDYSVFYEQNLLISLTNVYKNFKKMEIAKNLGFKFCLNGNTLHPSFSNLYREILPSTINTLVVDYNHKFNNESIELEKKIYSDILEYSKIKNVIVLFCRVYDLQLERIIKLFREN